MSQKSPPIKIARLEIENTKRVKAFHLEPAQSGLTVIGGKNGQGKTSVLDAIAWALGGAKHEPSHPQRDGSMSNPEISLTLSNGLRVERKGKNATLTVTDPTGARAGQQLLDSFVSQFALDLPKFLNASKKEKADTLLRVLGIGDQLAKLDQDEQRLYNERHALGQIANKKEKHAAELPEFADAPAAPVSISELIKRQQAILSKNGENQRLRDSLDALKREHANVCAEIARLEDQLKTAVERRGRLADNIATGEKSTATLVDESTAELEASIANIEEINAQVSANAQKAKAFDEAEQYRDQYNEKTLAIEKIRSDRMALLDSAPLPLPGLVIDNGEVLYNGQPWDCMSGSEQLRVAVAIVRAAYPACGFVLMDELGYMDVDTLAEFGRWLEAEGLQAIGTRPSTGAECTIIIEDGLPVGQTCADVRSDINQIADPQNSADQEPMEW